MSTRCNYKIWIDTDLKYFQEKQHRIRLFAKCHKINETLQMVLRKFLTPTTNYTNACSHIPLPLGR